MAGRWGAVTVLGAAQFVMVLDSTVMNVSISKVVTDLHTTIAGIQAAITFYTLTMAAFMLLGAKLGDIWGRRRALIIGSIVYAVGSGTTALSPNIVVPFVGVVVGYVDLGRMGVADRWADIAIGAWSTEWNYGPGYDTLYYEAYGVEPDEERITYYRALWDAT